VEPGQQNLDHLVHRKNLFCFKFGHNVERKKTEKTGLAGQVSVWLNLPGQIENFQNFPGSNLSSKGREMLQVVQYFRIDLAPVFKKRFLLKRKTLKKKREMIVFIFDSCKRM
jgi:hypothetical protein